MIVRIYKGMLTSLFGRLLTALLHSASQLVSLVVAVKKKLLSGTPETVAERAPAQLRELHRSPGMLGTTGGELTASQAAHSNSISKAIQHQPTTSAEGGTTTMTAKNNMSTPMNFKEGLEDLMKDAAMARPHVS